MGVFILIIANTILNAQAVTHELVFRSYLPAYEHNEEGVSIERYDGAGGDAVNNTVLTVPS